MTVGFDGEDIKCDKCEYWRHSKCEGISDEALKIVQVMKVCF